MNNILCLFCFFICVFTSSDLYSQESYKEALSRYKNASLLEKTQMDTEYKDLEAKYKMDQVKSACGVNFGDTKKNVKSQLNKRYGTSIETNNNLLLAYNDISYGGLTFDMVIFKFQSDGKKDFLSSCIFVKGAKTDLHAKNIIKRYYDVLNKSYNLIDEYTDDNGFTGYMCGVSPLWDGHWHTLENIKDVGSAIITDIIECPDGIDNYKYYVRIIYGSFDYVNEKF